METERYSRQIRLSSFGEKGQQALASGHAVVAGCGALGSIAAELLARAGVGRLTVIDRDYVELSNLQRQTLFDEQDAAEGLPKAVAAERRLKRVNSQIDLRAIVDDLRPSNAIELLEGAHVIIDATDNFEARYLINDVAVKSTTPWVYGAAVETYGITTPFFPSHSACFRCIYPSKPAGAQPTCETAGVLSTITCVIGSLQASIALQILSGNQSAVRHSIVSIDVWNGPLREIRQPERDLNCPCCEHGNYEWLNGLHETPVSLCGRNAVQLHAFGGKSASNKIDLRALGERLRTAGEVRMNEFALRFFRNPHEITVFADGRAIIKGTTDAAVARSIYARWIGS